LVQQESNTQNLTVGKGVGGTEVSFAGQDASGGVMHRKLTGVADGSQSNDAVNYGQLSSVKSVADQNTQSLAVAKQLSSANATATAAALGGGAKVGVDGKITAPSYAVGGKQVRSVGDAVVNLDGRVSQNATEITRVDGSVSALTTQLQSGAVGLVQQESNTQNLTVGKGVGGTEVSFAGQDASGGVMHRKLTGVAAGALSQFSSDAINGSQLYAVQRMTASVLGGGASVGVDGWLKGPTYVLGGQTYHNVGDALSGIDTRVSSLEGRPNTVEASASKPSAEVKIPRDSNDAAPVAKAHAASLPAMASPDKATAVGEQALAVGLGSLASAKNSVALGTGSIADRENAVSVGTMGNERQIAHVAPGVMGTDAVNLNQLDALRNDTYSRIGDVYSKVGEVERAAFGGVAAAMAMPNLTPSGPGRTMVAAGVGNYRGFSAVAAGVTYRSQNSRWLIHGAVSATQQGDAGGRVHVGFEF
jgi:autotransporter adhesin